MWSSAAELFINCGWCSRADVSGAQQCRIGNVHLASLWPGRRCIAHVEHKTSSESIKIYENLSESTGMQSYQWHQHWLFIYAFLTQPFSEVQFKPVVDSTCFKSGSFVQNHSWQKIEARANQSLQQGRSLMKRCGLSRHKDFFCWDGWLSLRFYTFLNAWSFAPGSLSGLMGRSQEVLLGVMMPW